MPERPKSLPRPWKPKARENDKMQHRPRSHDLYHTARWTRESREFRKKYPLCVKCQQEGIITPVEVVDHVIPFPLCDFWDKTNWQSLCRKHNIEKGNKDKRLLHERGINENHRENPT